MEHRKFQNCEHSNCSHNLLQTRVELSRTNSGSFIAIGVFVAFDGAGVGAGASVVVVVVFKCT